MLTQSTATRNQAESRALARAHAQHIAVAPVAADLSRWLATSASGQEPYTVLVRGGRATCQCEGAARGYVCKHSALVLATYADELAYRAWRSAYVAEHGALN